MESTNGPPCWYILPLITYANRARFLTNDRINDRHYFYLPTFALSNIPSPPSHYTTILSDFIFALARTMRNSETKTDELHGDIYQNLRHQFTSPHFLFVLVLTLVFKVSIHYDHRKWDSNPYLLDKPLPSVVSKPGLCVSMRQWPMTIVDIGWSRWDF